MWLAAPSGLRTRVVIDSPPRLGPVNVGGGRKPSAPPSRFPAECRSFPELHCPPRRPRSLGGTPVDRPLRRPGGLLYRSEEHTSELQSLMRISYAVFCLNKK